MYNMLLTMVGIWFDCFMRRAANILELPDGWRIQFVSCVVKPLKQSNRAKRLNFDGFVEIKFSNGKGLEVVGQLAIPLWIKRDQPYRLNMHYNTDYLFMGEADINPTYGRLMYKLQTAMDSMVDNWEGDNKWIDA